tara:strand:+ start:3119 stop:4741 length:1623 start_codon:yes stop_codon:yes gene_type:complete
MAEQLFFSRDSKLYIEFDSKLWEIPVLDGFSFSQSTNQSEISLSEMQGADGLSRRGNRVFTDSLAPAEWSFSTYVRPFLDSQSTPEHHAVEEALWAVMAGADNYIAASTGGGLPLGNAGLTKGGNLANAAAQTVTIDDSTAGITYSGGSGGGAAAEGWEIDITVAAGGAIGNVTYNVVSSGSGFTVDNVITIPNSVFTAATGQTISGNVTLTVGSSASDLVETGGNFYRAVDADKNSPFGPAVAIPSATNQAINFSQSNRAVLGTCNLYFVMETSATNPMVYKLTGAAFNEASIDFEVDGIATINWSGFAKNITDLQSQGKVSVVTSKTASGQTVGDVVLDNTDGFKLGLATATTLTAAMFAKDDGVGDTSTFIRNRLTQLLVTTTDVTAFPSGSYNLTLTGGNITISNNISYLVPEELGAVNIPIEHVTGGRTVNGNFTCYLTLETASGDNGTSVELFNDMTTSGANKGLEKVVNDFDVTFQIGGAVVNTPRLFVKIPKCHIDVPTHSVEDVISVETNFAAYTTDFNVANEVQLEYYGV